MDSIGSLTIPASSASQRDIDRVIDEEPYIETKKFILVAKRREKLLVARNRELMRIAKKIIYPVNAECISYNNLRQNYLPVAKVPILQFLRANRNFRNILSPERWGHITPDCSHLITSYDLNRNSFVVPAIWQQFFLGSVREGKVSYIMA